MNKFIFHVLEIHCLNVIIMMFLQANVTENVQFLYLSFVCVVLSSFCYHVEEKTGGKI